jgi:UDP-N-acetylmuramoylalanine--D-glutamate ligase
MTIDELHGKRVVILGLGKNLQGSGVGAAKWCLRHGMRVLVTDKLTRNDIPHTIAEVEKVKAEFAPEFVLGEHRESDILACDMVVQNPDVRFDSPFLMLAAQHGKAIETDLSLFFHFCPYPTIGITGTRGKTTTTMLTGAIMKLHDKRAVLGGNMRVSPLEALDAVLKSKHAMPIVLEISSWQAEALARSKHSPSIAAITNLSEDHLNRYGTMENYAAAKESLFGNQGAEHVAAFNYDDKWCRAMAKRAKGRVLFTSMRPSFKGDGVFWRGTKLIARLHGNESAVLAKSDVKLEGAHNLANVAMAVLLARAAGVPSATIKRAVRAFKGVPHRQEFVRNWKGIDFVNDTTGTSPDGVRVALDRFAKRRIILIGGGTDKNLNFKNFSRDLAKRTKYSVLFKGTATDKILADWPGKVKPPVVGSMKEAMDLALAQAKRGDLVLLSPGAASFGVFMNEFDRGEQFMKLVKKLK